MSATITYQVLGQESPQSTYSLRHKPDRMSCANLVVRCYETSNRASIEHYESLLKRATEESPVYLRLKNAVKMANTVVILCDLEQAEMLLQVAKHFCPDAVPQIERAVRFA